VSLVGAQAKIIFVSGELCIVSSVFSSENAGQKLVAAGEQVSRMCESEGTPRQPRVGIFTCPKGKLHFSRVVREMELFHFVITGGTSGYLAGRNSMVIKRG
jgi:hypothetical protein